MRLVITIRSAVSLFILVLLTGSAAGAAGNPPKSVPGEVVVKFKAGSPRAEVAAAERANDVSESERLAELRTGSLWRLKSRSRNTAALIAALEKNPHVEYAEPNFILEPFATPNDPDFPQLWALRNTLGGMDISAEAAWNVTTGSKDIVVGVVDTGVNYLHPDLAPNMWVNPGGKGNAACGAGTHGFNARTNTCDPMDDHYHGSHVAGTIGAAGNNGIGVTGVNWNVSIMALKFLGSAQDPSGTTAGAIAAINFGIQAKIDGVNVRVLCNSWGGGAFSKALLDIINKANENDILFVAAAGNKALDTDLTPHYPGSYQTLNMITVAATDSYDGLASFSNWGAKSVHIGAPGVGIYSTSLGTSYVTLNGTSMATPHVVGVAALVLAKTPSMTTAQLRNTILSTGDPIASLAGKTTTGRRLNAARAVGAAPLPNFSLTVGPNAQTVSRGATATYAISVLPVNNFSGPVALTVTGLPQGATGSFNPASTSTTSTLSITTSSSTPLACSELVVTGEGGGLRRTAWASLSVSGQAAPVAECPSFVVSPRYSVGAAMGVAVGDFNGDAKLDAVSVEYNRNTASVLLSSGASTFFAPVAYAVGAAPMAVATGDVNGDGHVDLITANSGTTTVSLLPGNGDGTFLPAVQHEAGANPFAVAIGDFNRDGKLDIVSGNNGAGNVSVLLNNGNGTFATAHYPAASGPYSVAVGDVDTDGDPDLAIATYNAGRVVILRNAGDGTFAAPLGYDAGANPSAVALGDFNRDGAPDLAVANTSDVRSISVLRGNGDGTFGAAVPYSGAPETNAIAAADMNGDGKLDLVAASGGYGYVSLYLGNGDGTFQSVAYQNVGSFGEPTQVAIGDLDSDGRPDVVYSDSEQQNVAVLFNTSACVYNCGAFTAGAVLTPGTSPKDVASGDFNGDGRSDLAIVASGGVSIRTGNSDGTFGTGVVVAAGTEPDAVTVGDFNRDGEPDLAIANSGSNDMSVALGSGNGTFAAGVAYAAGTRPTAIAAGDLNRDGRPDLVVANQGSDDVSVFLANGNGTFANGVGVAAGSSPTAIVIADFDRDAIPDLAVTTSGANVAILLGNGSGGFDAAAPVAAGASAAALVTGDWNRDGRVDLAIANGGASDLSITLGNGDGTFQTPFSAGTGAGPAGLVAGDFNIDGITDLAVANSGSHDVSILSGNGNGSFAAAVNVATGLGSTAVVAGDWNGDGKPDLGVVNGGDSTLSILISTCPRPDLTVSKTHTGDFTQGGSGYTFAIVVGNVGPGASKNRVTVEDTLPRGLRATGMSGNGWACDPIALNCTRSDALAPGASYPSITLTVAVALTAPPTVTNYVLVRGGGDATAGNNSAADSATVIAVTDLVVALTHDGSFVQGATGRSFKIVAKNAGGLAASGSVTVSQLLPAGLTATAITGSGWNCTLGSLTCTRSDALGANSSYPAITVTVDVAADARSEVISTATISGGNDTNAGNNTSSDAVLIWSNAGCGAFGAGIAYGVGSSPTVLTLGDFTGDGRRDVAVANLYANSVSVIAGRADGTFAPAVSTPTGGVGARGIEASDLNLDGKLDVVVLSTTSGEISVLLGNGDGTFLAAVKYVAGAATHSLTVADLNTDGLPDVAVTNGYMSTVSVFLAKGGGALQARTIVPMPAISVSLTGVRAADLNADGALDLIAATDGAGLWRFTGNGDGSFQAPINYLAGSGSVPFIALGDVNRDGKADVIATNQTDGAVTILIGAGDGSFQAPVRYALGFGVAFATLVDGDGDGAVDVLASTPNLGRIYTLRGNGDGTFQPATGMTMNGPGQFAMSDFNGDSRPDIAMISNAANVTVLLGGCADLAITKTHTGNFTAGMSGTYTINVMNVGTGATNGTVTVVDTLPAGMVVTNIGNSGWTCSPTTVTCTRSDSRNPNTSYQPIYVTVTVPRTAPASVTNTATVSGGADINAANNVANDVTTIVHVPDLKVSATHVGLFAQGQTDRVYTIVIANVGSATTSGPITVTDNPARELTLTGISGAGWTCDVATRSCTRSDILAVDATFPAITVTVNVAVDAQLFVTNTVTVSGGGDAVPDNNSVNDWTTILATPANVVATAVSQAQINVTWKAVQYATRYQVLRSTTPDGPFAVIETPLTNSFLDSSLTANTTYFYRVQAGDPSILTMESATASATTAPAPLNGTGLHLLAPCRLIDTRGGGAIAPSEIKVVEIAGRCGIPAGAKSVVMNITAVNPGAAGGLTVYPADGSPTPITNTISYRPNRVRASNAVIKLSADGRLHVFNTGTGGVDYLIDVTGYFQ